MYIIRSGIISKRDFTLKKKKVFSHSLFPVGVCQDAIFATYIWRYSVRRKDYWP